MATTVAALRTSRRTTVFHRSLSTLTTPTKPRQHKDHSQNHVYLQPTKFIGSFDPPQNPKEALSKLALIRRDYAKQVKEIRKQYIDEMELHRQEKLRKDEAKKLEIIRQSEERRKLKAAAAQARAVERQAFEEELRLTLMKEKAEKLEYWKLRQKKITERKNSKKELICQQSSKWIEEKELEAKILEAIVDSRIL